MSNILETVVNGLAPRPTTRLQEATFRFNDGSEIHLEGDALDMWVMMYRAIVLAVNSQFSPPAPPRREAPSMTVDEIRNKRRKPDDGE